ncbi:TetR/AcrR family transcriptional regulator [Agromyces sp. SYSU T00194]|uniref:TetR/AcrR family transcriptional regulator n=1 Tax=Agromyces chitinivorans TaxID=3158560 RepID=UPI003397A5A3
MSAADRRDALVRAALRVVARRGLAQATTRAIVAEAGMSLASFHYAFASRDELVDALIAHVVGAEGAAILGDENPGAEVPGAEIPGADVGEVVRLGLRRYLDHLRQDPDAEQAMLELTQHALRDPARHDVARRQYAHYRELAEASLEVAAERARVTWTRPVADIAGLVVAMTDGITMTWLVTRDDAVAEAAIDLLAETVAAAARPTDPHAAPGASPETGAPQ